MLRRKLQSLNLLVLVFFIHCSFIPLRWNEKYPTLDPAVINELPISNQLVLPYLDLGNDKFIISQKFGTPNPRFSDKFHCGEDVSLAEFGDGDKGAPVFSIGEGLVVSTRLERKTWGRVLRVIYKIRSSSSKGQTIEVLFAHLERIWVAPGDRVKTGDWIASMGDSEGTYSTHLHWEIRKEPGYDLGGGYVMNLEPFLDPSPTILNYNDQKIAK
jgi:murein DD-endopeptidase MepM/ murein hydrolase activator NlpD